MGWFHDMSAHTTGNVEVTDACWSGVLWLTGLPASGKTTLACALEAPLSSMGHRVIILDGDRLRQGLCANLGFSEADRDENVRRVAEVAKLFFDAGSFVICSLVSPMRRHRAFARSLIAPGQFFEGFVRCSLPTCQARDPKGLYAKARRGAIAEFTGISAPYEAPIEPELLLDTELHDVQELVDQVMLRLNAKKEMPP